MSAHFVIRHSDFVIHSSFVIRHSSFLYAALLALASLAHAARADVIELRITHRVPLADGQAFGRSGPYEKVTGRLHLAVDPQHPANQRVTDLGLAPRGADGKVEFWTDFYLLKPLDMATGNRRLFYEVNNRGNKLCLGALDNQGGNDPTTPADAGNGFLLRQGYAILWCGWNGDVLPGGGRLEIGLPTASQDGKSITGQVYAEICVNGRELSQPFTWGGSDPYPAMSLDNQSAWLAMRPRRSEPAMEIPRDQWAFARWEDGEVLPDAKHLYVQDGFRPGWLYELVYTAADPRITGLGFVAVRDAATFFRYEQADAQGNPNPLAGAVEKAYVFGISQSARFIHHFLYEDFNGDEMGRSVFDAAFCHVGGAGKGMFNGRFAQTTRHGSHHEDNLYPVDFFPFTSVPQSDPVTGQSGDIFQRARQSGHLPKIFFSETSTEYWSRGGSLLHTDVEATHDMELDPNLRLYFLSGAQHGISNAPDRGIYHHEINTLDHRPLLRALLVALDRWVTDGIAPPESRYPRMADGTLVDLEAYRKSFPKIPAARVPESFYAPLRLDAGPHWPSKGIADRVPPLVGPPYRTLVPAVDADGNERAGIRLPEVAVPLATYTGWNVRRDESGAGGMLSRLAGSQWPLARDHREREQTGDPRLSIQERYPTHEIYLARIAQAALELQSQGFLLEEDVLEMLKNAAQTNRWSRSGSPQK